MRAVDHEDAPIDRLFQPSSSGGAHAHESNDGAAGTTAAERLALALGHDKIARLVAREALRTRDAAPVVTTPSADLVGLLSPRVLAMRPRDRSGSADSDLLQRSARRLTRE